MGLPAAQARVLGRFAVVAADGTEVVGWERPSARRLVCLLLLAPGRRLSRDAIADALFPALPPKRAANAVSKALTMARAALAGAGLEQLLEADRTSVWIAEDATIELDLDAHVAALRDALAADGPRRAAALRDALRADGVLAADDPYEEWALAPRRELDELRGEARAALAREAPPEVEEPGTFGRRLELARLERALAGRGAALVTGSAGIGKSHLLAVLARRFRARGVRVLEATAIAEDRLVPFAALRTALRPLRDATGGHPLAARLLDREPQPREGTTLELATDVADLLAASAPLLLVLDDVHWADRDLRSVLARLAALPRSGWALLLGARTDEPGAPVAELPSALERVDLRPLPRAAIEDVVRSAAPAGATRVRELARRSGGNPFFALELARHPGAAELPATIASLLLGRVAERSDEARRALELVVVAGDEATYELVLGAGATAAAVEELLQSRLLVEHGAGVRPIHPLEREAVAETLGGLRRGELHALVADTLERLGSDDAFAVARHRLAALDAAGLRAYAGAAARDGIAAGLEARALLADDVARELLESGLAALEQAPDAARAFDGRLTLGEVLADHGELERAAEELERALALAETDDERGRAWSAIAGIPYRRGDLAAAATAYERGLSAAASSPAVRARLASDLGWMRYRLGRPGAVDELRAAAEELERAGEWQWASRALDRLAVALSDVDATAALAASERAFAACARTGDERELATLHVHRARALDLAGRHADALDDVEAAARLYRAHGTVYLRSILHRTEAKVREHLDDLEGALAARDAEIRLLRRVENTLHLTEAHAHRAALLDALGHADAAAEARADAAAAGKSSGIAAP